MLEDKIAYYKSTGKMLAVTPTMYKEEYPFLKEVDSLALANMQLNLQKAYKNFFNNKRIGFPKFKSSKHSRKSYTTNNQKGTVAIVDDKYIKLPKIGKVRAVIHRKPDPNWVIKSATVSMDSDHKFFVSVLFEYDACISPVPISDNAIGIDYKSDGLFADSNGHIGSNHKFYRESHKKLSKAQRKLRHKTIGSNNYNKQQVKISRIHKHISNQRLDYLHKLSTEIANRYDIVCAESLNMKSMSNKDFGNGKATMDNGYGIFLNMLEYKLSDRGKYFIKVDKWYPSSQICHRCGTLHPELKDLQLRTMFCDFGLSIYRDLNAAINIKTEGLRILYDSQKQVG